MKEMMHVFKNCQTTHLILDLKMSYDKLCVKDSMRVITMDSHMFSSLSETQGKLYGRYGWYVGKLYGVDIYSDIELPVKLTVEERLTRLEEAYEDKES